MYEIRNTYHASIGDGGSVKEILHISRTNIEKNSSEATQENENKQSRIIGGSFNMNLEQRLEISANNPHGHRS